MTDDLNARLRVAAYLERRKKSAQTAYGDIHSYDVGCDGEVVLLASDLEALLDNSALTQSRAETAAAYERAAQEAHKNTPAPAGGPFSHTNTARVTAIDIENEIRALATPYQSAALDAVRAEAREQGMREAANVIRGVSGDWSMCQQVIRAAIKGAKA
jgi:hypothetical protein